MDLLDSICTRSSRDADAAWEQAMTGRHWWMDLPRRSGVVCGDYVLRTSHFDTDAARRRRSLPQQPRRPWLGRIHAPPAGSAPPAGTDRPCSGSVRVPDDRVLIRRGRPGQASEVGPPSVYPSRRIDGNAGVIADEAAGALDVRIGGLRRD